MKLFLTVCCVTLLAAQAHAGPLEVGFAACDVTPTLGTKGVYIAGFGQNRKATAVHDPIMLRVVALRDGGSTIALVSVDVIGLFPQVVKRCRDRLPEVSHLTVSATHNHEGPDTMGLWGASPLQSGVDKKYLATLEDRLVEAVRAAVAKLAPTEAEIATVPLPEWIEDKRLPVVKHDELTVLRFRHPETRKSQGVVVNFHSHPETLGARNTELSADFVSHTVNRLAEREGCAAVYLTGTVGGLLTSLGVNVQDADGKALADGTHEKTRVYGERIADAAGDALKSARPVTLTPIRAVTKVVRVPVENGLYKLAWQAKLFDRPVYHHDPTSPEAGGLLDDATKPAALETEVGYLTMGELGIALIPGEIYPELVLGRVPDPAEPGADFPDAPPEPAVYPAMPTRHKMLIGLANDEIGYLIPRRQWDAVPPYCYGRKRPQYGEENSVGPDAARVICEAFADLTRRR